MSDRLYGVWPISHNRYWDEYAGWSPQHAPQCQHCKKLHWLSLIKIDGGRKWCRAIVADGGHIADLERFRDLAKVEWGIVGFIEAVVLNKQRLIMHADDPFRCRAMPWMPLRQFWEENEHNKRLEKEKVTGVGGKLIFPGTHLKTAK
jgi:hypothetical protein